MKDDGENPDFQDNEHGSNEYDSPGETVRANSQGEAREFALRTARLHPGKYGRLAGVPMAFEVETDYETENRYVVTLLYRPQDKFSGAPGRERFFIEKTGGISRRQIIDLPEPERRTRIPDNLQDSTVADTSPISVPWSVMDMAIGTAIMVGGLLGFLMLLRTLDSISGGALDDLELIWLAAASEGLLVYVVWRLSVKKYGAGWHALGFRRPRTRRNGLLVAATLVGSLIVTGIYAALVTQLDIKILLPEPVPEGLRRGNDFQRLMTVFTIAGLVPVVEEVFFRGFLFQGLASRYGLIWGAVLSAAVFSLSHLAIGTLIPIFMIGVLFAVLYAKTRSLWMPISAHVIQNFVALTLSG